MHITHVHELRYAHTHPCAHTHTHTLHKYGVHTHSGPPLRPAVNTSVTSRSALISWDDPFSLIPITNYTITIMSGDTNISMETVSGNMLYFNATALRPNTNHTVTVVAVNRAGESEGTTEVFTTLEDGEW